MEKLLRTEASNKRVAGREQRDSFEKEVEKWKLKFINFNFSCNHPRFK